MAVKITGNNIDCPGQIVIGQKPSSPLHSVRNDDKRLRYIGTASLKGVDLSQGEFFLPISASAWIPIKMLILNASDDVSDIEISAFTEPEGGGDKVIDSQGLVAYAPNVYGVIETFDFPEGIRTASGLYIVPNSPANKTIDLILFYHDVSVVENDSP